LPGYLIIVCSRCESYLLAKSGQKTRTCPYCGLKVAITTAKKVATIENGARASELLRKLKERAAKSKMQRDMR